jgi:hypothetical protein
MSIQGMPYDGVECAVVSNIKLVNSSTSLHAIATALNERGIRTAWGRGLWTASQVRRVVGRLRGTVG